ncbi:MAG: hypothetical protein ACRDI2_23000, partial [Chloroflexota bacterium]
SGDSDGVQHDIELRALVARPQRGEHGQRPAIAVAGQVRLDAQSTVASPERVGPADAPLFSP